jgi:hypothetical protein
MTVEIASFAVRICAATCSAERTIPSSSFSTPSAPAISFSFIPNLARRACVRVSGANLVCDAHRFPRRRAMAPMLNLCEGHVFVELNYPHIIGVSGYERHHDMAT